MGQPAKPCPFDSWEGNSNPDLEGGYLLAVSLDYFAYAFSNEEGEVERIVIARKVHGGEVIELFFRDSEQLQEMMLKALEVIKAPRNIYLNDGVDAGETLPHHPHLHVAHRRSGEPASGKGLTLLVKKVNEAYAS
jgi:hypothetical protein